MRTTINLDDDVLIAVREIARERRISVSKALSDLVRQALSWQDTITMHNGVPLIPVQPGASVVTSELVYRLLDEAD